MSSEAGSVFPLSRLSVFDFSPLSPTNKAANTTAADTAFFFPPTQMWMAPLQQRAPDPNPASPWAAFARPHTHSPLSHPCSRAQKRRFIAARPPALRNPPNVCACLEHFAKTLVKSTCKWFVYLRNGNKLLSLVISLLLNREPVLAWEQTQSCYSCMGSVPRFLSPSGPPQFTHYAPMWTGHDQEPFLIIKIVLLRLRSTAANVYSLQIVFPRLDAPNHFKHYLNDSISIA